MSRVFWMAVGAVGGIVAYRKGTRALEQARELGPLGTARAAAAATSRLAGRTAHGLGRLEDVRDRRAGRLVIGSVEDDLSAGPAAASAGAPLSVGPVPGDWVPTGSVGPVPADWVPASQASAAPAGRDSAVPAGTGGRPAPSVVILAEGDTGDAGGEPEEVRPPGTPWPPGSAPGSAGSATARTPGSAPGSAGSATPRTPGSAPGSAGSATPRTTRPRRG